MPIYVFPCLCVSMTLSDYNSLLSPRLRAEALGASQDSKDEGGEDVSKSLNTLLPNITHYFI